jgi:selenocysteine lyase/cysteine desulfurase
VFCVDAIQSLGALRMDVQACQADIVVADAHKWMLGPEGIALFYIAPSLREAIEISEYGWHMVEDHTNYDRKDWIPARSARRFECGSPNMLGIHALNASLSLLLEVGMQQIEARALKNSELLTEAVLASSHLELLSPTDANRRSAIVSFFPKHKEPLALIKELRSQGIICALRGGAIRYSPHFYTERDQIVAAVAAADAL